jgi:hypothetical protein
MRYQLSLSSNGIQPSLLLRLQSNKKGTKENIWSKQVNRLGEDRLHHITICLKLQQTRARNEQMAICFHSDSEGVQED